MRNRVVVLLVASAALLAACDIEGGDPVQHALRDAAAARQAAALKTTEEEQASAARRAAAVPAEGDELSRLIASRRQAVEDTRALLAATTDPALKGQLTGDLKAEEGRLRALEARAAAQ
ncbi:MULTISPECIES: indole-3-glycerol-phosphate synthase [unclassified Brevundimonas]|uniref:indole-3-glycerol-phosphate synthase n=1 Tax=unclassified Brevundimonas TaxID=2622653 RepID=UPI000CFCC9AA|nr:MULTISPECIES: indole-3-glycerol-phosphate synthase [unclassified Brevundimonas]PRA29974.1 indole-3-glycerol-phosphate synthase [Brevundimonas sp. MYb27]PQZ80868.1 indole-3-glycerol-phosphate synthase [Brevundimonas sp. MYb31]PRB14031.1 indole-3-glycerol-phosphate synthase [Brevundimonas sp. MYb52]PRB33296.1 indole-3-glycerol-phosphate synthase [Brevundimonas sp. MYb46]PRB50788.1 indole-3-glycerol-phosphate synthase [Brevundimonas sp. MYb33]